MTINGVWTQARGKAIKGTVLLCNGGPGCCDYMRPVSEMLEDAYRVIRFEQRGCGRSIADGRYDLQTTLRDMEAIREAYGLDEWIICGHSWGADLALIYALEHPRHTSAVVFMAGRALSRNIEWAAAYHANKEARGEVHLKWDYPFNFDVNKQGNRDYNAYVQQPKLYAKLAKLDCPVLLLAGGQDIRPYWPVEQLHHLLPNSTFKLLPNAAHYLWQDAPQAVCQALRTFLNI